MNNTEDKLYSVACVEYGNVEKRKYSQWGTLKQAIVLRVIQALRKLRSWSV